MAEEQNIIRTKGRVKWFNPKMGFGFMEFEDGTADTRLHITCVKVNNAEVPLEGSIVDCDIVVHPKGNTCVKVHSVDNSTGIRRIGGPGAPEMTSGISGWVSATVKWYSDKKGFGFLIDHEAGQPDIFMHEDMLDEFEFQTPERGEIVMIKYADTTRGRMAFAIKEVEV